MSVPYQKRFAVLTRYDVCISDAMFDINLSLKCREKTNGALTPTNMCIALFLEKHFTFSNGSIIIIKLGQAGSRMERVT